MLPGSLHTHFPTLPFPPPPVQHLLTTAWLTFLSRARPPALQVSPTVKALAGSLGGVVEACTLQPIDVAKTRLQLDHSGQYKGELAGVTN